uniref:NIN1 (RPN12) binding n=1 Tax=Nothoprocta perdicaria TaxID=30464 RepID=A0A8C6Z395_NOTPE
RAPCQHRARPALALPLLGGSSLRSVYTVPEVVAEIRDKATRRRLAALPYELRFRRPRPDCVRLVTDFARKTGDYPSLSATDLQVLALTYELEAETVGPERLRREPEDKVGSSLQHPEAPLHLAGFHLPSKDNVRHEQEGCGERERRWEPPLALLPQPQGAQPPGAPGE